MRLRERPLFADGIDSDAYVDREVQDRLLAAALAERNTLLLGDAGTGKTTLLRWLRARLRERERRCAFVNGSLATDVSSFADLVADALEDAQPSPSKPLPPAFKSGETLPASVRMLHEVRRLAAATPTVILVDELTDAQLAHDWFGRLRDELWALGHTWVVAARTVDSAPFRRPPADAFWSALIEVDALSPGERDAFLERGLEPDEREVAGAAELPGDLTARELVTLLRQLITRSPDEAAALEAWWSELRERAARLGGPERTAFTELEALGRPVSAQDPELLERLEWSRAYAQRVLARLDDAGLVRVIPERAGGQGRPRKLYEPAPYRAEVST